MSATFESGDRFGSAVLRLTGEITSANSREVGRRVLGALHGVDHLRVDMSEVTYVSSAGLRILVILHRNAEANGTKVTLSGLGPQLRFVMRAAGFLELFAESAETS